MRYSLLAALCLCVTMTLFQNCEMTAVKNGKMFLPSDVSVIEPYHNEFSETTSTQKTYRVSFDLQVGNADARMIEGSVVAGASECDFDFSLSAEQIQEIKHLIAAVQLCSNSEGPERVCAGSCPFSAYNFYSDSLLKSSAPVENGWLRVSKSKEDDSSSVYFCGGHEKLFEYLRARVAENIPSICPNNFPILF